MRNAPIAPLVSASLVLRSQASERWSCGGRGCCSSCPGRREPAKTRVVDALRCACRGCATRFRRRRASHVPGNATARPIFSSIAARSKPKRQRRRVSGDEGVQRPSVRHAAFVRRNDARRRIRRDHETRSQRCAGRQGGVPRRRFSCFCCPTSSRTSASARTRARPNPATRSPARLAIAHGELGAIRHFDYVIINEQAPPEFRREPPVVDDLEAIVRAERFRIHHYDDATFRNVENA